ncbi:MAG: LptF/LptG family permease [Chitinophagaceae bacterium]
MKVLHRFIIKSFLAPFISAFMVTWFIFIMQFMWVWIDEFIGKGLDLLTILHFFGLLSLTLIPISLPLGILFAALMTYGNLGESSELVAVKSSGISIASFTKPLFLFVVLITILSFLFNNYVIPSAQLKATTLLYDIQNKKPIVSIKPGSFFKQIPNHTIYISKKDADNLTMYGIKIYDHTSGKGNDKIIYANEGKMYTSINKRFLIFELKNGWRYEDKVVEGKNEQIRLGFSFWKKIFDISEFKMPKTDESYFKNLRAVMNVAEISKQIDTAHIQMNKLHKNTHEQWLRGLQYIAWDTLKQKYKLPKQTSKSPFLENIQDSLLASTLNIAEMSIRSTKGMMEIQRQNYRLQQISLNENKVEWHKRFTIPMACILLFIIGAALGSIIRKGGLGMPFIVAVIFFVIYYFLNTIGEKISQEQVLKPVVGMWMPSLFLFVIGIFLMFKANNDSPLMNKEWYFRMYQRIKRSIKK